MPGLKNAPIGEIAQLTDAEVQILGLVRDGKRIHAPGPNTVLKYNDIVIIESDADDLKIFLDETKTKLVGDKKFRKDAEGSKNIQITEALSWQIHLL